MDIWDVSCCIWRELLRDFWKARKLQLRFTSSQNKNTLPGWIYVLKSESKLHRRNLDIERQEDKYEQRLFILKCNQQCTPHVFRSGNKSSNVTLTQLKILKLGQRCCWFFCKQTKRKKVVLTFFEVENQKYSYAWCIGRSNSVKKPMIILEVKMLQERYK